MQLTTTILHLFLLPLALTQLLMPLVAIQNGKGSTKSNSASTNAVGSETEPVGKNFLITFMRNTKESVQNEAISFLEAAGATIKQVYDYKVYKGILFTVLPSTSIDSTTPVTTKDINWWTEALKNVEGVKGVEEEQIVTTQ